VSLCVGRRELDVLLCKGEGGIFVVFMRCVVCGSREYLFDEICCYVLEEKQSRLSFS
jgi:hypothetical protein